MYVAQERLFLTADRSAVVAESDPRAAFLFAAAGSSISDADAARYGLTVAPPVEVGAESFAPQPAPPQSPAAEPEAKAEDAPAETKAFDEPEENKAEDAPARKGRRR